MATGVEWLQKQKKSELAELAGQVGMKSYERMKKSELEVALEDHLRTHQSSYASNPSTAAFYQGVDPASPVKHRGGKAVSGGKAEDEKKPRQRRQTMKAKEEAEGSTTSSTTTPARSSTLNLAQRVPLPPSPAALANAIDIRTTSLRASLSSTLSSPRLTRYALSTRDFASSSVSLTLITLLLELWGLRYEVLPFKYAFTIPAIPALGIAAINVAAPDFFALLTAAFWGPVLVWAVTSVGVPLVGAWVVNLQGANAKKGALVAWIVFSRHGVEGEAVEVVGRGVPGGATGLLVGAFVGGLAGVYEALLMK